MLFFPPWSHVSSDRVRNLDRVTENIAHTSVLNKYRVNRIVRAIISRANVIARIVIFAEVSYLNSKNRTNLRSNNIYLNIFAESNEIMIIR